MLIRIQVAYLDRSQKGDFRFCAFAFLRFCAFALLSSSAPPDSPS